MIQHVWELALAANVGPVVVAAGEEAIAQNIRQAGGQAIMTDANLPSGSDRIHQAMEKFDPTGEHDIIVNLQGDLPTLDPQEIRTVVKALENSNTDVATLAAIITDEAEMRDPNVVKVIAGFESGTTTAKALTFTTILVFTLIVATPWISLYPYRHHPWKSAKSLSNCVCWKTA